MDNHEQPQPAPAAAESGSAATASRSDDLLVEARGLGFTYRGAKRPTLRDLDFRLAHGELLVLMGGSGAGKSTFCRCLNGLVPNFQKGDLTGTLSIGGKRADGRSTHDLAHEVALVFQDFESQLFCTSVAAELAFGPENLQLPPDEIQQRLEQLLPFLGLEGFADREPSTLSGGQKQRLALGAALALAPKLLVLDEPTSDLDPAAAESVFTLARGLRETGMGLLVVDHDAERALEADLVVLLHGGRIRAAGPPRRVLSRLDLLEQAGVRPPSLFAVFAKLGDSNPPFTPAEAKDRLLANGWYLDAERYSQLLAEEEARSGSYGQVLLEVERLHYQYGKGAEVLKEISFSVRKGEFVALIGENGSGKTTLAKHLNGLLTPTGGSVRVDKRPTGEYLLSELGRRVGYVFQNPDHQLSAETVYDEVAFAPRNAGLSEEEVGKRVTEALAAVDLQGREQGDPFSLTKGERQRVAVASVLSARPDVLVFDEPTTGLDAREQRRLMRLVRRLNEEGGHTVLIITHSMWTVAEYAHRCLVMSQGELRKDGAVRAVLADGELLASAQLQAPPLVRFTADLGAPMLTPAELEYCLVTGEDEVPEDD